MLIVNQIENTHFSKTEREIVKNIHTLPRYHFKLTVNKTMARMKKQLFRSSRYSQSASILVGSQGIFPQAGPSF